MTLALRMQQEQHEINSDHQASVERLIELQKNFAAGDVNLPRTQAFIARAYASVQAHLEAGLKQTSGGGKYKGWVRRLPAQLVAVISLREVIALCTAARSTEKVMTIQTLGIAIGRLMDTELRIQDAEKVNPVFMQKIHDQVRDNCTTSVSHIRKLYSTAHEKIMAGNFECTLTAGELLQIGKFGVQAVMDAGFLELHKGYGKGGTVHAYRLAPEVFEYLADYSDADVQNVLNKSTGAMMCKPEDWTTLSDGGYLSARRKHSSPLMSVQQMRRSSRSVTRGKFTAENMPKVFKAANYLQGTEFRVDAPTLAVVQRIWEAGGGCMGIPRRNPPVPPACPFPEDWVRTTATEADLAVFTSWKFEMRKHYTDLKSWRSRVREVTGFLRVTRDRMDSIWFPVFFDTRGRWYYRGSPNPQGTDIAKAVLHSGIKKPLGKRGLYWLRVAIANLYGFDKARFDDRALWTQMHWAKIRSALGDPENHPDVWGNDSPIGMLSAALELHAALSSPNPEEFESDIFVHMDATCSGLQHFSAMLRDPTGGTYVNLTDPLKTGPKQDIYARVAVNCMQSAYLDMQSTDESVGKLATWWYSAGIPRDMAKTPVNFMAA